MQHVEKPEDFRFGVEILDPTILKSLRGLWEYRNIY